MDFVSFLLAIEFYQENHAGRMPTPKELWTMLSCCESPQISRKEYRRILGRLREERYVLPYTDGQLRISEQGRQYMRLVQIPAGTMSFAPPASRIAN